MTFTNQLWIKISSKISINKLINFLKMSQSTFHQHIVFNHLSTSFQLVEFQSSCHSSTRIDVVDFYDDRSHIIITKVENQYNCLIFFTIDESRHLIRRIFLVNKRQKVCFCRIRNLLTDEYCQEITFRLFVIRSCQLISFVISFLFVVHFRSFKKF